MGVDPLNHRPFQKNSRHRPSASGNVGEPGTARSREIVPDFFHCPPELSTKSEQVSDAASGLARKELPRFNLNLNLELSITRPSIQAAGKEAVVNSEQGESNLSEGKGYLCRHGECPPPQSPTDGWEQMKWPFLPLSIDKTLRGKYWIFENHLPDQSWSLCNLMCIIVELYLHYYLWNIRCLNFNSSIM
jgi:hypothetical protein